MYRPTDRFQNWFVTSLQTDVNDTTTSFRLNKALNVHQARLVIDPYDEDQREIVKVTSVDGNLVYVERGDDNTTPQYHLEGTIVALHVFAADLNDLYADWAEVEADMQQALLDAADATSAANIAANSATSAAGLANNAASSANDAASDANLAAGAATSAAGLANSAATLANNAANSADDATDRANDAAEAAEGVVDDVAAAARNALAPEVQFANGNVGVGKIPDSNRKLDVDGDIYSNGEKVVTAGEWQSWTPSFTNFNLGNGTINYARYSKIGNTVHYRIKVTLGSTSSVTGRIAISLPTTSHNSYGTGTGAFTDAVVMMRDVSGSASFGGVSIFETSSSIGIGSLVTREAGSGSPSVFSSTSATTPFTWATGDIFKVEGSYESA